MTQTQTLPKMNRKTKRYFFKHAIALKSNDFFFFQIKNKNHRNEVVEPGRQIFQVYKEFSSKQNVFFYSFKYVKTYKT